MDKQQVEQISRRMQLTDEEFEYEVIDNFADAKDVLIKKRQDYGHLNLDIMGSKGLVPYLVSKVLRVYNLFESEQRNFESIEDSLIDVMNYCNMALIYLEMENDTKEE